MSQLSIVHFVNIASYTFLCTMEVDVNQEITCKRQNHSLLCNKSYKCSSQALPKRYKQKMQ